MTQSIPSRRAIRNVLSLFLINGVVSVLGFLTQLTLANRLGTEQYGLLGTYVAIGTYIGTFVRFGRERTLLRDLVHYPDQARETVSASLWLSFALASFCAFGFAVYAFAFPGAVSLAMFLVVWGNVAGFFDLQQVYDYWRQMGRHAIYNASARLVYYGVIWSSIFFAPDSLSLVRIGLGTLLGYVLAISLQLRRLVGSGEWGVGSKKQKLPTIHYPLPTSKRLLSTFRANFPMMLLSMLDLVYGPAPILLLAHFHGKSSVGVYILASQFLMAGNLVLQQITRVGSPRITSLALPGVAPKERRWFLLRYLLGLEAIAVLLAAPLLFFSEEIVQLFFRPEYHASSKLLPIFGLSVILIPISQTLIHYVLGLRRDRPYVIGVVLTTVLGFCVCVLAVQRFAATGAAWSYFFTLLLGVGVNFVVSRRCHDG